MLNFLIVDNIIKEGLKEDAPFGDITTDSIISPTSICKVNLIAKEVGIICGFPVFKRVFELLGNVKVEAFKKDGDTVFKGEKIALVTGNTRKVNQLLTMLNGFNVTEIARTGLVGMHRGSQED